MILLLLMLFAVILVLSFSFKKNRIAYPILTKTIGLLIIVFSLVEYAIKLSTYVNMFPFEYSLYITLSKTKLSFRLITLLENVGFFVFMLSSVLYFAISRKPRKPIATLLLCIPACIRFFISTMSFEERLYLFCHTAKNSLITESAMNLALTRLQFGILIFYMVIPYIITISNAKTTRLLTNKRNCYYSLMLLSASDIISSILVFISDFQFFSFLNLNLLKYPVHVPLRINNNFFIIMTLIIMAIVLIIGFLKYTPLKKINPDYNGIAIDSYDENIIMLLHTYKNAFCAISQYADIQNSFLEDNKDRLQKVKDISDQQFQTLSNIIDIAKGTMKQTDYSPELINIKDCIESALTDTAVKNSVTVTKKYCEAELFTLGNRQQIIEVFRCLIQNSIDAISTEEKPTIAIAVGIENDRIYINFTDNGIGIKGKDQYKIFNPLFSSKMGGSNFGIGLTYAKRVIEAHGGSIALTSKYKKTTTFQVVLPAIALGD